MKRRIMHNILPCLLIVSLFLLNSCKSNRIPSGSGKANTKALDEFVASVQEQEIQFHTLSARLSVDLDASGKKMGSRVEMKLVKDSALQLSVQPFLGIEVFRIELSKDSIKVMDRMNRRYVAEGYSGLKAQLPIDFNFYNLQALFINHLFLPGKQELDDYLYDHFKLERNELITRLHTQDRMDLHYLFEVDNEEKLLSTQISDRSDLYALVWKYSDFQVVAGRKLFPHRMDISLQNQGTAQGGMHIYYSRIQFDKALNMDFRIPSKYKRITFDQILRMLIHHS